MGAKGKRRREKNYIAAHGGSTRLPPPPDLSSVDAVPAKLRKIMSVAGAARHKFNGGKGNTGNGVDKGAVSRQAPDSAATGTKRKRNDQSLNALMELGNEVPKIDTNEKKKKKRKSKKANDLRFETVGEPGAAAASQRKERKKQRLEERKKKHKKPKIEEDVDFRGHEEIKFGEVVEAPPKLLAVPKAFKTAQDASQERLRLRAVEAYRKRKGWASRPGVELPPPVTTSPFL